MTDAATDTARAQAILADLRQSIDNLDAVLVHTLAERFRCTTGRRQAEGPTHPAALGPRSRRRGRSSGWSGCAPKAAWIPNLPRNSMRFIIDEVIRHHQTVSEIAPSGAPPPSKGEQHGNEDQTGPRRVEESAPSTASWPPTAACPATVATSSVWAPITRCLPKDSEERVKMNMERVQHWLDKGAQPTDRIARMLEAAGVREKPSVRTRRRPSPATEGQGPCRGESRQGSRRPPRKLRSRGRGSFQGR